MSTSQESKGYPTKRRAPHAAGYRNAALSPKPTDFVGRREPGGGSLRGLVSLRMIFARSLGLRRRIPSHEAICEGPPAMGLFDKLKQGLKKTTQLLKTDVRDIF